jgi:hypothetical protein
MSETTYVDDCLGGRATLEDINDYIDAWHDGDDPRELHDFLGMTWDEYRLWVERPASLRHILFARRHGIPVESALEKYALGKGPVAARARTAEEAREVLDWLRQTGRLASSRNDS